MLWNRHPVAGAHVKVDRFKGFAADWDPSGSSKSVSINISQFNIGNASAAVVTLSCEFPTSAGTGTVPTDVLKNLKPSAGGILTTVAVAGSNGEKVTAGGFSLAVAAMVGGLAGIADVR